MRVISSIGADPMIWDNFLFLKQIAPSSAAQSGICCVDFSGCRAGKMASKFPIFFIFLVHTSIRLCRLEFCSSIFDVSCSSFCEVRQC